jgi:hypothetical protein
MKILVNAIKCLSCGTIALSVHRHDFRYCKCQKVAADGGTDYLKRTGAFQDYQEESLILVESTDSLLLKQKVIPHHDERREQIPQPVEANRIYKFADILEGS